MTNGVSIEKAFEDEGKNLKDFMCLMINEKKSLQEIAYKMNMSCTTARFYMKKYNLKLAVTRNIKKHKVRLR